MGEVVLSMRSVESLLMLDAARCRARRAKSTRSLLEKYLGHHAFVLMAQQMTVEEGNAADDGVGEIHHQIDISLNRYIDCIPPFRAFELNSVLGVDDDW